MTFNAVSISIYEIFSNLFHPWQSTLEKSDSSWITKAVNEGIRPTFDTLQSLYPLENKLVQRDGILKHCWDTIAGNRPLSATLLYKLNQLNDLGKEAVSPVRKKTFPEEKTTSPSKVLDVHVAITPESVDKRTVVEPTLDVVTTEINREIEVANCKVNESVSKSGKVNIHEYYWEETPVQIGENLP